MTPDQFVQDAIRTESIVPQVQVNPEVFKNLVNVMINVGTVLDQIKKNAFYKKPFKIEEIQNCITDSMDLLDFVACAMYEEEFPNVIYEAPIATNSRIVHSVIGIATEAVELLEAIDFETDIVDEVNIREEFGDLLWYIAIGVDQTGGNFDAVMETVIAKLKTRYPDKFTSEAAINRDLVKERAVLEGKDSA